MHIYAQNNLQLFNQLRDAQYSPADVELIARAYRLAIKLFTCRYQSSGKLFLSHVVGTASILAHWRQPAQSIAAGLLHNVYRNGDFGDGSTGIREFKAKIIRAEVGDQAEAIVAAFVRRSWTTQSILALRNQLAENGAAALPTVERDVILLRLADQLEHELDFETLYFHDTTYRARVEELGDALSEIAQALGFPGLGQEMKRVNDAAVMQIPAELIDPHPLSYVVVPRSFHRKFFPAVYRRFWACRERLRMLKHRRRDWPSQNR